MLSRVGLFVDLDRRFVSFVVFFHPALLFPLFGFISLFIIHDLFCFSDSSCSLFFDLFMGIFID